MLHIPSFLWAFYRLHFKYLLESCNKIRTHQVSAVSGGGVYAKLSLAFSIQIVSFFSIPLSLSVVVAVDAKGGSLSLELRVTAEKVKLRVGFGCAHYTMLRKCGPKTISIQERASKS